MYSFCLLVQGTTTDNNYKKNSRCYSSCQDWRNCNHEVYQNKDTHRLTDKKSLFARYTSILDDGSTPLPVVRLHWKTSILQQRLISQLRKKSMKEAPIKHFSWQSHSLEVGRWVGVEGRICNNYPTVDNHEMKKVNCTSASRLCGDPDCTPNLNFDLIHAAPLSYQLQIPAN
jgi:hypothetical protein